MPDRMKKIWIFGGGYYLYRRNNPQKMIKPLKITGWIIFAAILLLVAAWLLARFVFRNQVEAYLSAVQRKGYVELLREAEPYRPDTAAFRFEYLQDTARRRMTREYFRLDTLDSPAAPTWDRAIALARFVAANIPHANQSVYPERRNAIDLWEYTRTVEPAFNCRLHSIMLHELMTACDITSRYVTCLPADSLDQDCHVVNIVWLPEREKWAMVDSDMCAYLTDTDGTPLSLGEMRTRYLNDEPMEIHPLLDDGRKMDCTYYRTYWSKNLYWFECVEQTAYDKETPPRGQRGRTVVLAPEGYAPFDTPSGSVFTHDAERFWAAPDPLTIR